MEIQNGYYCQSAITGSTAQNLTDSPITLFHNPIQVSRKSLANLSRNAANKQTNKHPARGDYSASFAEVTKSIHVLSSIYCIIKIPGITR